MMLTIDNLQGAGPQNYASALDSHTPPKIVRKLNQPGQFVFSLVAGGAGFIAPMMGARVALTKSDGGFLFTGYVARAPKYEYLGWGAAGAVYRYVLIVESDEMLLDQKALPNRSPFVNRTAGSALKQLAQDLLPGGFDVSGVQDVDVLAEYAANPQKKFSEHAAAIALAARGSYRAIHGKLMLSPVGAASYGLSESDASFSPAGLTLESPNLLVNDATVIGLDEPQAYVRDYFVGDGLSLKYYMSQKPFGQSRNALIDDGYLGTMLDSATWTVSDPATAVSVVAQTLQVAGGSGVDGQTTVKLLEQIELGGALQMQHGDVSFSSSSHGVLGGLYAGAISAAECLAGFQITPSGGGSSIQALVNGVVAGPVIATQLGHRYVLTTFLYSNEVYRSQQVYHSSEHPASGGWGGGTIPANVRVVLEVHDVDPSNPATLVAPATVLYDGVISGGPAFCSYALVNAVNMHCSIAFTYVAHISLAEVRTAMSGASYVTQVVGSLADGAQCLITSDPALSFYPAYAPALNEFIVVSYRGFGRAVAEVENGVSVAALGSGPDDGLRGAVRVVKAPSARTASDCENAALAILDDSGAAAWSGSYRTWSDFLPGAAADIFPGDALVVSVPSRGATFTAIVREVEAEILDPLNDRSMYSIVFANDLAEALAMQSEANATRIALQDVPPRLLTTQVGNYYLPDLTDAQITAVSSTTVQIDVGFALGSTQGVEVRIHDYGWGVANDRNLLGRFGLPTFTLPRLARTQNYFLRLYDSGSLRYSRYSAALHLDYPL